MAYSNSVTRLVFNKSAIQTEKKKQLYLMALVKYMWYTVHLEMITDTTLALMSSLTIKGIKNGCPCIVEIRGTQGCALVGDPARAVGECRDVAKAQP